jgi:hypothetical protein
VAIKKGELLPMLVWGPFTSEQRYKMEARAKGESEEFPAIPVCIIKAI